MTKKASGVLVFIGIAGLLASMVALQWEGRGEDDPVVVLDNDDSSDDDDSGKYRNLPPAPTK
tara:strand:+ start:562 stop:747 length:186 start_codon:yes stop_codon:yes gene_type:complete